MTDQILNEKAIRYTALTTLIASLTDERKKLEKELKTELHSTTNSRIESPNWVIAEVMTGSLRMNTKKFKEENPEMYRAYLTESVSRHFSVTPKVPNQ